MSKGMIVGYVRVSTPEQTIDRQLDGVDVDKLFSEYASAKDTNRPVLQEALRFVREGDTLLVHSMDRLARNLADLLAIVKELNSKNVIVKFLTENIEFKPETNNPMSTLILSIMGACAEFERNLLLERQREGIRLAQMKGLYKGRKKVLNETQLAYICEHIRAGTPIAHIARHFKLSRETIYRYLKSLPNQVIQKRKAYDTSQQELEQGIKVRKNDYNEGAKH